MGDARESRLVSWTSRDNPARLAVELTIHERMLLASLLEQIARRIHSQGYAADLFPAQWAALRYIQSTPPQLRTAIDLARVQGLASGALARCGGCRWVKGRDTPEAGAQPDDAVAVGRPAD